MFSSRSITITSRQSYTIVSKNNQLVFRPQRLALTWLATWERFAQYCIHKQPTLFSHKCKGNNKQTNLLHTKNHVCVINKPRGKTTTLRRVVCGAQPTTFYIFFSERSPLYSHDNTTRNCACACVAQAISFNSVYAQDKENFYTTTSTMVCVCVYSFTSVTKTMCA